MARKIYIVGAHSRARTLAAYLQYLYPDMKVEAYLYDNEERNPARIGTVPVIFLDKNTKLDIKCPVYIGTRGTYHSRLVSRLREMGYEEIYPVTVKLDSELRNAYLRKYFLSIGRKFLKIEALEETTGFGKKREEDIEEVIYVAKSAFDKPLKQEHQIASYEKTIQVGAELTNVRLYPGVLTDNVGDNISVRNTQYCELTAMYWIWKHAAEDIVGLVHYRRHFILPENWVQVMQEHDVDVILPVPLYVAPSIADNYKERHDSSDWEFMMHYLKEQEPHTYQKAEAFFAGNLYSPCNMFIMKKGVLNEFCEWLFPILEAVTAHGGQKEDVYQNRYPGFLSERLLTFYFEKNREVYKIVYADKDFLK